jgi:catechol 2,3-dioxygenase-like lactoylglutathione lyase family enzyme
VYRLIEAGSRRGHATGGLNEAHVDHHRSGRCRSQGLVVPDSAWPGEIGPCPRLLRQIFDADGAVLLCLHQWGTHGHPTLTRPNPPPGTGLLLFFRVDNFDEALPRARALVSRLEEEPHLNPNTATMEFALRDPDGYYVMVSALSA